MTPELNISSEAQQCIDEHLDAIDDALRSNGIARSERQNVLDDVQTQILEMLADQCKGAPNPEDARALIAEMDPPESYASELADPRLNPEEAKQAMAAKGSSLLDKLALALCVLGVFVPPTLWLYFSSQITDPNIHLSMGVFFFLFVACQFCAFILGLLTRTKPAGKAAALASGLLLAGTLIMALLTIG